MYPKQWIDFILWRLIFSSSLLVANKPFPWTSTLMVLTFQPRWNSLLIISDVFSLNFYPKQLPSTVTSSHYVVTVLVLSLSIFPPWLPEWGFGPARFCRIRASIQVPRTWIIVRSYAFPKKGPVLCSRFILQDTFWILPTTVAPKLRYYASSYPPTLVVPITSAPIWFSSISLNCIDITTAVTVCASDSQRYTKYLNLFRLQKYFSVCFRPIICLSHKFRSRYTACRPPSPEAGADPLIGVHNAPTESSRGYLKSSQVCIAVVTDCLTSTRTSPVLPCRRSAPPCIHVILPFLLLCGSFLNYPCQAASKNAGRQRRRKILFLSYSWKDASMKWSTDRPNLWQHVWSPLVVFLRVAARFQVQIELPHLAAMDPQYHDAIIITVHHSEHLTPFSHLREGAESPISK